MLQNLSVTVPYRQVAPPAMHCYYHAPPFLPFPSWQHAQHGRVFNYTFSAPFALSQVTVSLNNIHTTLYSALRLPRFALISTVHYRGSALPLFAL